MNTTNKWFHWGMTVSALLVAFISVVWSRSSSEPVHGGLPDGSWIVSVLPISGPPGTELPPLFYALMTMTNEGSLVQSDIMPPGLPQTATPAHGEWTPISYNQFALTYFKLLSNGKGSFQGVLKIREIITLDITGTKYSGQGQIEVLNADGDVTASFEIITQASLIRVEQFKSQP